MIDETAGPGSAGVGNPTGGPGEQGPAAARVGFCQECGRVVTTETVRRVGPAIYCEPCQNARATTGAWQAVPPVGAAYGGSGSTGGPGYTNAYTPGAQGGAATPPAGMAHPLFAALLGFIPGVGAMYNGQYAKGFAHLLIFALFASLADDSRGVLDTVFGLLVAGWVFYQVFDAYATARARIEGQPLPNPFGLNEIGERIGLTPTGPRNASGPDAPPFTGWTGAAAPVHPPEPPPATNYAAATDVNSAGAAPATTGAGWTAAPYQPTFTGAFMGDNPYTASTAPASTPASRFPTAAVFLVGVGLLLLIGNLLPRWHFEGRWLAPIILAGLSVWILLRRLQTLPGVTDLETNTSGVTVAGIPFSGRLVFSLRAPVMLFAIAVLLALQSADWAGLSRTWPVLCIVWGGLMLLERTAGTRGIAN